MSLFAREILAVLTPEKYHSAYTLVPGISFYFIIQGLVLIFSTLLYTNNRVKWVSYLNGIQMTVFFASGLFLIPVYHAAGVVAAMDISVVIYFMLYLLITLKTFYFNISAVKLSLLLFIAASGIFFFNTFSSEILIGNTYKALFIIALVVLTIFILPDKKEKLKLKQIIIKKA